jgi:DNA invertase Pin-like site-specific DNA recombinase
MKATRRIGVGCVRVSTDRQERSIDEQKEAIRAAALRDGVELLEGEAWCEDDGISGSILARPGLQKLLSLCRTRLDITDVYFWKRNRLTRSIDPLDGLSIEREIERSGKQVHFVQGIQKTGNRLLDFIAGGLEYAEAGQYLVNLSSDTIRGLVPLTKAGFDAGRPTPYGFNRMVVDPSGRELYRIHNLGNGVRHKVFPNGDVQVYENDVRPIKEESAHSTLVPGDPERIATVRRIFESYARAEQGIRTIVEELNGEAVPSPRGGLWSVGTVRSILVNPVYYGANVWNVRSFSKYHTIRDGAPAPHEDDGRCKRYNEKADWVMADEEHGFEGIISKELFDLAQERRLARNTPFTRGKAVTAPYYLSGLLTCSCGHHLQGQTKTSGKRKGYRKYHYYTCGGFMMKGRTVCKSYLLPKESIEGPVLAALARRIKAKGRIDAIRQQVEALLAEYASPGLGPQVVRRRIAQIEERRRNWEKAIDKGLNIDLAIENLKRLDGEKEALERELALAQSRKTLDVDVQAASREILAGLDRLQEVLEKGSVAEVKAILRAYIGRVEYDHETNRARVGFLRLPTRALVSRLAPESARISVVAGARYEPLHIRAAFWRAFNQAA